MDHKTGIKKICLHAKAGEFSEVLKLISGINLVKENAINILIAASNACYHSADKCDVNSIEKLLNTVVTCIDGLEERHLNVYLQSVFHITKLLCKKERYEDITKIEAVIIPKCIKDSSLKDMKQAEHTYVMLIKQISQSVGYLAQAKNTKYNKHILGIIKIILKAHNKLSSPKDLLNLAQMSLNQISYLELTNDQLSTFYNIVLDTLGSNFGKINEYADTIQILLVPIFSSILADIIQSRNFEFAMMFLDIAESQVKSNFKQPEYFNSHTMFKAVTALFPVNKDDMIEHIESAKLLLNSFKTSHKKLFYNIANFIEEPLLQLLSFYKNAGLHMWTQLPESTILNIITFLMEDVVCNSMLSPKKCSCGCSIPKHYSGTLKIGCQMVGLLKVYIDQSKNQSKEFFSHLGKWLYFHYGLIKKLKDGGCQKWKAFYSELAGYTYNISVVLYKAENIAHKATTLCFLKNSLVLEGTAPALRPVMTCTFAFSALCEAEFKSGNWIVCMALAALHCLLYMENSNIVFQNWWIKPKMKVKDDVDFQQQTLLSVLSKQMEQLNHIFHAESLLTTENKVKLLNYELTQYKAMWRSKVSMMAAFKHLSENADIPTIAQMILQIYGDGEVQIHNDMSAIFSKVKNDIETFLQKDASNSTVRLALAVLYYYIFKITSRETADKNLQEMEKTMQVMESAKKEEEKLQPVPKDANDECDIVSAYSNLRLTKFIEILDLLNTCQDHVSALMNETFETNIFKSISKLLTKVAFEYRLHCFSIKSLQSFEMSMRCAQKIGDDESELFALGFLIETADVRKHFVAELIGKGDELVRALDGKNSNGSNDKTLAIYHVCKSRAFLYEDPKLSYDAWQKADALCLANKEKDEFQILRAQLYIILYKLTKNCEFIKGEHERQPMTLKLHCAYDIVIEMVQKNVLSSFELCVLFDTVYELAKVYNFMRLPRDLRAYSKHSVLLTQKIVLPMRCVSFLILLAHSDLATSKFDHCNVKLNGIDDIFCLGHSRPLMVLANKASVKNIAKSLDDDVEECSSLIEELVLDVPRHSRQYSPASPTLTVEGFKFPQFMSHKKTCMCFMCLSLEFQELLLEKYHLNALLNIYEKEDRVAEEFIGGSLALYKTLIRNYDSYVSKASKLIPESLVGDIKDIFIEVYSNILYDYSSHMCRKSRMSNALNINLKLLNLLQAQKMRYVYLYHDSLLQRLSYIVPNPQDKALDEGLESRMKHFNVTRNENQVVAKTPTSKKSTVTVMVNGVTAFSPPLRRGKKCNLFGAAKHANGATNESPAEVKKSKKSEDDSSFTVPTLKAKKSVSAVSTTPFLGSVGTPKINIFTDDEPVRTYSRKKATSVKNQSTVKNVIESNTEVLASVVPKEAQQIPVISGSSSKRTRGQLLTHKIKESSSARIKKKVVDELLKEKVTISTIKENIPVNNDTETTDSSVVSDSPEQAAAAAKTKVFQEKLKTSAKESEQSKIARPKRVAAGSDLKKNLQNGFQDSGTNISSSNSSASGNSRVTKSTGAVRKSTRNRVL